MSQLSGPAISFKLDTGTYYRLPAGDGIPGSFMVDAGPDPILTNVRLLEWSHVYVFPTTDPGVVGKSWLNNGLLAISSGYSPSLDFSKYQNSMYLGIGG